MFRVRLGLDPPVGSLMIFMTAAADHVVPSVPSVLASRGRFFVFSISTVFSWHLSSGIFCHCSLTVAD